MCFSLVSAGPGMALGAAEEPHSLLGYQGLCTFQGGTKILRDLCLLVSSNKPRADDVKLLGRSRDLSVSASPFSKADSQEGLRAFLTLQHSWMGPDWVWIWDHTVPEAFCKVLLLSTSTGWQWQGIKASGPHPANSAPLLWPVWVQPQPQVLCPRAGGLGEGTGRSSAASLLGAGDLETASSPSSIPASPGSLRRGSDSSPRAGGRSGASWGQLCPARAAPSHRRQLWGRGDGLQQLLVPVTCVLGTWESGVLPRCV